MYYVNLCSTLNPENVESVFFKQILIPRSPFFKQIQAMKGCQWFFLTNCSTSISFFIQHVISLTSKQTMPFHKFVFALNEYLQFISSQEMQVKILEKRCRVYFFMRILRYIFFKCSGYILLLVLISRFPFILILWI